MDINTERERRRRKGQTLAEFAITLPIVLLLMFGIIEFGRIFQAWVTLQNAARAAARYASTGQFFDKYQMKFDKTSDPDGFIPCVADSEFGGADQRGTLNDDYTPPDSPYHVKVYTGGLESLFATWYDGRNCHPDSEDDQAMRKDMARLLSIMEEARRGASGLALESNPMVIPDDKTVAKDQPWYEVWKRPYPRSDQRGWFHVMICSTRAYLAGKDNATGGYQLASDGGSGADITSRFAMFLDGNTLYNKATGEAVNPQPIAPACVLNEKPTEAFLAKPQNAGLVDNAGIPWMDPGGPGDSVTIVVTFNHPLITPLGLAPYIQMQARRTAIVESFRAPRAVSAINNPGVNPPNFPTDTPEPTDTPTETLPPTDTPTPTETQTPTPTATDRVPFDCARITYRDAKIQSYGFRVTIDNDNDLDAVLTRAIFQWKTYPELGYDLMNVSTMGFYSGSTLKAHWTGQDTTPPTDTDVDASNPTFASVKEKDRKVSANNSATWGAVISNGPNPLLNLYDHNGTQLYFLNPLDNTDCVITIDLGVPTPTKTPNPNKPPTKTPTPNCEASGVEFSFYDYQSSGKVRFRVKNNDSFAARMTDFNIVWQKLSTPKINLARVTAGAPYGSVGSVLIWESSNTATEDANPPTHGKAEGVWKTDYVFPPKTTSNYLYIDFDGTGSSLGSLGVSPMMFNGSSITVEGVCPGRSVPINTITPTTPPPSPRPSDTSTPYTPPPPTDTPRPQQPTNTPRPQQPTDTPVPTNTPKPQQPPTRTPQPTDDGGNNND